MRLPNAERAIIDGPKVRDYLLAAAHPVGRFKSTFFFALGYRQDRWRELERDLRALALSGEVQPAGRNAYGHKYLVRGTLTGPARRPGDVVTIWIVLNDDPDPRLVTAFPGGA